MPAGRSPVRSRRSNPESTRLTGLTRTKLAQVARMAASPVASTPHTESASREIAGSAGTVSRSAARQAVVCAWPLVNARPTAAHVHSSQPGRVARWRWSEETYGTAQSRRISS